MENKPATPPQSGAKVYEMLWDCKFCGTKKLLGKTHRFCPNCGGQQDPSWRYFPSDAEKVAVQDHVYVGADKICKACNSLNGGAAEFCGNCGAPLSGAATAQQLAGRTKGEGESFETENLQQRQKPTQIPGLGIAAAAKPAAKGGGGILSKWKIIAVVVVVLIGGLVFALTRTVKASAYVTGYEWERTINLESLQPVHDKTNCERMPGDAYSVSRSYEQVDTRQIPDGQTCTTNQIDQGDGTFREERSCETKYRSEPVMGYMCTFMVNRWVGASPAVARGDKTNAPYWPSTDATGCFSIGCKREGSRNERYILKLRGDGDRPFECPVDYDLWQETKLERGFDIEVGTILKNFVCSSLKPTA